jgi:hypothetical protein
MKSNKITDTKKALRFMFSGKAVFTFINTKTQNRFTYKLKKAKDSDLFFVYVLTSPETWTYTGYCVNGDYKHGKKSKVSIDAQSVKVFNYMLKKLKSDELEDFLEVWHEGFCGKCGKSLTVPLSIETGLGPNCLKTLSKSDKRDKFLDLILQ